MDHFKELAAQWDTEERIGMMRVLGNAIRRHLPSDRRLKILELGCGTGLLALQFLTEAEEILGIDSSPEMLRVFDERFKESPQVSSECASLESKSFDGLEFDVIVSSMAFHHLVNPELLLERVIKTLRPGGIVAVVDLDEEDGTFHPDPKAMGVHHFGFSKSQLQKWSDRLGDIRFEHEIVYSFPRENRTFPLFLGVFKKS